MTVVRYSIIFGRPIGAKRKCGYVFSWGAWWTGDPTSETTRAPDAFGGAGNRQDVPELVREHAERFVKDVELKQIKPAFARAWRHGKPPVLAERARSQPAQPMTPYLEAWDARAPWMLEKGEPYKLNVLRWYHSTAHVEVFMWSESTETVVMKKCKVSRYDLKEFGCAKTEWGTFVHLPDDYRADCKPHVANVAERMARNAAFFVEEDRREDERWRRYQEVEEQLRGYRMGRPFAGFGGGVAECLTALGLGANATEPEVNQAFRRLALKAHPDRGGSNAAFIELTRNRDAALRRVRGEIETMFVRVG